MRPFQILIVEDDDILSRALKAMLMGMSFRNIDQAGNGFDALKMLISNQYDLIFLDNQMPEMSGLELLRRCKSGSILNWTTVVMITGGADSATINAIRSEELKVDEFIVKPIDFRLLSGKVDRLLRGKNSPVQRLVELESLPDDVQQGSFLSIANQTSGDTATISLFGFFLNDDRNLVKGMPEQIAAMPEEAIVLDLSNVLMIDEVGIGVLLLTNSVAAMAGKRLSMIVDDRTIGKRLAGLGLTRIIPTVDKSSDARPGHSPPAPALA